MAKAKKDPAFLFYPGDASEDTQFMNRLERGAYFDLLKAQKKLNRFSVEHIKKVLGNDFAACWPALELILGKDEKGYYIDWLEDSILNRKEHSKKQKEKIDAYWERKRLEKLNQNDTTDIPRNNHGTTTDIPLVNGNEIENGNENINTLFGKSENLLPNQQPIVQAFKDQWQVLQPDYPFNISVDFLALYAIGEFLSGPLKTEWIPETDVGYKKFCTAWKELAEWINADDFYQPFSLTNISKTSTLQTIWQKSKQKNGKISKGTITGKPLVTGEVAEGGFGSLHAH